MGGEQSCLPDGFHLSHSPFPSSSHCRITQSHALHVSQGFCLTSLRLIDNQTARPSLCWGSQPFVPSPRRSELNFLIEVYRWSRSVRTLVSRAEIGLCVPTNEPQPMADIHGLRPFRKRVLLGNDTQRVTSCTILEAGDPCESNHPVLGILAVPSPLGRGLVPVRIFALTIPLSFGPSCLQPSEAERRFTRPETCPDSFWNVPAPLPTVWVPFHTQSTTIQGGSADPHLSSPTTEKT